MHLSEDPIHNIENLVAKNSTKGFSIYLMVIVVITVFIICLPIINIDITGQSRGYIRSSQENTKVISITSGQVNANNIKDNLFVKKGDTLVIITPDEINIQKQLNDSLWLESKLELDDYVNLLKGAIRSIKTKNVKATYLEYTSIKKS